ncbi:MAG TPA: GAF domain-containing SpoIIE family protein phosphatase [Acidimicrobiales bacterium]|nr:GAF domain-containing SpoIIE family protein phosphatase [Acidimicrobiales bacterium]
MRRAMTGSDERARPSPAFPARPPSVATEEAFAWLSDASTHLHPDDVVPAVRTAGAVFGLSEIVVYLVDLEQRWLVPVPMPGQGAEGLPTLAVDTTVAGRAYRTERPVIVPREQPDPADGPHTALWFPLLDSAERLGVLSAISDGPVGEDDMWRWAAFVALAAEILGNKSSYGDLLTIARRTQPASLAAEMRWAMLPPMTFTGRNLTVSGVVLPPYDVAGDTFDYAVNGNTAHIVIIDAVGHGLEAARIANLAVSCYRNGRRAGRDMVETYEAMDRVVADEFGDEKFATAQLATIDLLTGAVRWLNAGHPPPMVIRQGHRIDLTSEVWLPVGLGEGFKASLAETSLEPDDVLLFFSDGITEARSSTGSEFGRERLADLIERRAGGNQVPSEVVRGLSHAVLAHQEHVLQDDATLLLVSWRPSSLATP